MRFIATTDWQLGVIARLLGDDVRARLHQARLNVVGGIGRIAARRGAGFTVIDGDIFELGQLDRSIFLRVFKVLRTCPVPVLLVPDNHDSLDASSIYQPRAFVDRCLSHVAVAGSSEPIELVPRAEVVTAPWFSRRPEANLVAGACATLQPPAEGVTRVLVGYGAASGLDLDRDSPTATDGTALAARIRDGLIHFAVLEDRHFLTEVVPGVWYPGTSEVTTCRKADPGNILLVEISGAPPQMELTRIGRWNFTVLEKNLSPRIDVNRLTARLQGLPHKERTTIWLELRDALLVVEFTWLDEELAELETLFTRLDTWERYTDLVVLPDDRDFADLGLTGFASDALREPVRLGAENATTRDALSLLYRLSGGLT